MAQIIPALRAPSPPPTLRRFLLAAGGLALVLALAFAAKDRLIAQVAGDRGIAPVAATGDIATGGIAVNVIGKNALEAREAGWKLAMRKAWEKLGGPAIADSQLESMVSTVVIEREQIGARRYIASLGVVFDRTRAGAMLGAGGPAAHSAPMLVVPVLTSGGTDTVFEVRNAWQQAWAEFQAGASAIDYVRASGSGGDSLLLTYGQTGRRSRSWWRGVLDEFGAADVIIPIAHLERQWPGGPVIGRFTARYGPDSRYLDGFSLRAANEQGVPKMMNDALLRFDAIFTKGLLDGKLRPDPTLTVEKPEIDPTLAALIEIGRRAEAGDKPTTDAIISGSDGSGTAVAGTAPVLASSFTVQFVTPDASSVDAGLSAVRGTPGVRGAATSSIAIGGVSVMSVSYSGNIADLAAALRARGWRVVEGSNALSIRR